MAEAPRQRASAAWAMLAAVLGVGALIAWPLGRDLLEWQPTRVAAQPWRAWSAAFVHYSVLHLVANTTGAALVGALGVAARVPWRSVVAWFIAWPLTHCALLWQPALLHYGGLSGVLHAGIAVVAVHLLIAGSPAPRRIGATITAGLALKLLLDAPWQGVLRHPAGWDIAVAPMAHVSGVAAGAVCACAAELLHRLRPRIDR